MENKKPLGFYFKKIHDIFVADANIQLKKWGLTFSQMEVLIYLLKRQDTQTLQKDIEIHFNLKHPTVIGTLKRMEKKGLIKSVTNPEDRRGNIILLTDKAFEFEKMMVEFKKNMEMKFVKDLSDEQKEQLVDLLGIVYNSVTRSEEG